MALFVETWWLSSRCKARANSRQQGCIVGRHRLVRAVLSEKLREGMKLTAPGSREHAAEHGPQLGAAQEQ